VARISTAAVFAGILASGVAFAQTSPAIHGPALGLPPIQTVDSASPALVELGRRLFGDTRLSRDGTVSCATCHDAVRAFTDGKAVSVGVGGASGTRNAPSLINVTYATSLFWDGRRATLEAQVADPFTNAREHGLASEEDIVARVTSRDEYRALLGRVFPGESAPLQPRQLFRALAAYLRTLRAGDSAFDRYYYAGDKAALDEPARRGLELFRGSAGCSQCHTVGAEGALFTDDKFHRVGIGTREIAAKLPELTRRVHDLDAAQVNALVADPNISALGRFLVTKDPRDIGKYKTPSLRNVALTAPYMHDGRVATLREAVDYEIYYRSNELERAISVTPAEREDLVAFLRALTSSCVGQATCPGMFAVP
jgi:cytochrome c peroxidase